MPGSEAPPPEAATILVLTPASAGASPRPVSLSSSKHCLERQLQLDMLLFLLLLWGITGVEGGIGVTNGYTLNVERKSVAQEGLCVLVSCNFSYPKEGWTDSDPIHGYWFRQGANRKTDSLVATNNQKKLAQKRTQGRFFLLGDLRMNDCSLSISEIRKEDAGSYFFRLERGNAKFNYIWNMMTLNVTGQTWSAKMPWGQVQGHECLRAGLG